MEQYKRFIRTRATQYSFPFVKQDGLFTIHIDEWIKASQKIYLTLRSASLLTLKSVSFDRCMSYMMNTGLQTLYKPLIFSIFKTGQNKTQDKTLSGWLSMDLKYCQNWKWSIFNYAYHYKCFFSSFNHITDKIAEEVLFLKVTSPQQCKHHIWKNIVWKYVFSY